MNIKANEHVSRVLPLVLTSGEEDVPFSLDWTGQGAIREFNEPELTVTGIRARALAGEICVELGLQQCTYFVAQETGLVEKSVTHHRLVKLLPVPEAKPGDRVDLEAEALFQGGWRPEPVVSQSGEATHFAGDCKVRLRYSLLQEQPFSFPKPVEADGYVLSETMDVETVGGYFKESFDLSLPVEFGERPAVVVTLAGKLVNAKASAMCGWVKFEGEVEAAVDYRNEQGQERHEVFVFPVRYWLEEEAAAAEMTADADGSVEFFVCQYQPESNTGILRGLLHTKGRLSRLETVEMSVHSRSHQSFVYPQQHHDHHHHHKDLFLLEEIVGVGASQTLIQREIIFTRPARKVREPVSAEVRNLQHEIIPNKVIVRGVLHKQIFAVDAATSAVFAQDVDESFVHFVDVPGASPGMKAHIHARVEFVKVDIHPGGETARQVTIIEIKVKVTRFVKKDFVVGPVFEPVTPFKPSPVTPAGRIYIVRSGDTVWKIANMFGVSMEAIISANNLKNPNLIFPGQQLIIPR